MKRISSKATAAMFFAIGLTSVAGAQSFNIDFDIFFGDPGLGNGAPSSSFGAAAGQSGYWNRRAYGEPAEYLRDLSGAITGVEISAEAGKTGLGGAIGYRFEANTGDYALLLNDAVVVGGINSGGELTYRLSGLAAGTYHVYTYAAHVGGVVVNTPVVIHGASPPVEVVTGPMPGNALEHLVTHSIQQISVSTGSFGIEIVQPPGNLHEMHLNGIQVVMVSEPTTAVAIVFGAAILLLRRSNLSMAEKENK